MTAFTTQDRQDAERDALTKEEMQDVIVHIMQTFPRQNPMNCREVDIYEACRTLLNYLGTKEMPIQPLGHIRK